MEQRKPIYEFGEWIVKEQGELVAKTKIKGKEMGISDEEIRKTLLIAFQTLGEQAALSIKSLNQRIARRK